MADALAAPCINKVYGAITTLNNGGIGIFADGTILKREQVAPMLTVVADGHAKRCARGPMLAKRRSRGVVDEQVSHPTLLARQGDRHGIGAGIVVGQVGERHLRPRLASVAAFARCQSAVLRPTEHFQSAISQTQNTRLDTTHRRQLALLESLLCLLGFDGTNHRRMSRQCFLRGEVLTADEVVTFEMNLPTAFLGAGWAEQVTVN